MTKTMEDGIEMMVKAYAAITASLSKDIQEVMSPKILPHDVAAVLTYRSDMYIIHGFVIENTVKHIVEYNGNEVYSGTNEFLTVQIARLCGEPLPTGYSINNKTVQVWTVLHSGNGISLQSDLHSAGFINAFSSSPHRCHVRALRPEELEKYAEE